MNLLRRYKIRKVLKLYEEEQAKVIPDNYIAHEELTALKVVNLTQLAIAYDLLEGGKQYSVGLVKIPTPSRYTPYIISAKSGLTSTLQDKCRHIQYLKAAREYITAPKYVSGAIIVELDPIKVPYR